MGIFRRKPFTKVKYNSSDTKSYKSAWQRWRKAQNLQPDGISREGDETFLLYRSARAPRGFWRVRIVEGDGGGHLPPQFFDNTQPPIRPGGSGINWFYYSFSIGPQVIYPTPYSYDFPPYLASGTERPTDSTGQVFYGDLTVTTYYSEAIAQADLLTPAELAARVPQIPGRWGNYNGVWAVFYCGGGAQLHAL
jgi:hypothetical protein